MSSYPERFDPHMAEVMLFDEVADIFGHTALEDLFALETAGIIKRGQGLIDRESAIRQVCECCDDEPFEFERRATVLGVIRCDTIANMCADGIAFDDAEAKWYQMLHENPDDLALLLEDRLDKPEY